ncbi:MAG: PA2169 family four-helix-bundle protein [Acidobacteriota bacterium]|nr:PA2169 family four-helix-bundle protein [Acidobacteriota bacterium]
MTELSPRAVLNTLIETCKDGERGLLHAAELVSNPELKSFFTDTAYRRAQFATNLLPYAQRLGGAATADGTAAASIHRRWMDVRSAWSGHDDGAVVAEARRGDSVTVLAFKSAVEGALPATVRDLVEHEYAVVRESHLRFADLGRPSQQVM